MFGSLRESFAMKLRPVRSVFVLAALTVLAVALSVGLLLWSLYQREQRHSQLETVGLLRMTMEQAEHNFETADVALQGVRDRLNSPIGRQLPLGGNVVHLMLGARVAGLRHVSSIFVIGASGTLGNTSLNITVSPMQLGDRDYFRYFAGGNKDGLYVSRPMRNRIDHNWSFYLARPILDRDGVFQGVVVAAINIADLESLYGSMQLGYARAKAIYLADGTLIASSPHREVWMGVQAPELYRGTLPRRPNEIRMVRHQGDDNNWFTYAVGHLSGYPVLLSVADDESQSLAVWREMAVPIAGGAVLLMAFTVLVASYLSGKLRHREQLSKALSAADERYQHTIDAVMDAIVAVDRNQRIVLFNPSAEAMFGYKAHEALGQHIDLLIPVHLRGAHRSSMGAFSERAPQSRSMSPQVEVIGLRADGSEFPIESTISHSVVGGELQLTAVLRDVSQRRKSDYELRMVNSQLRELTMSLQRVREEERKRISRELHDELGQQLTGLKLSLSWLGARIKDGKALQVDHVDEMRRQMDVAIGSVRRIAAELRPRLLDDLDFREALTWHTAEFFKHTDLKYYLHLPGADLVREEGLSTALFRILQEALTNVVRHAHATQVEVLLEVVDILLILTIKDNGQGFDVVSRAGGIGVVSMRERCGAIGANFQIDSAPGQGTRVTVSIHVPSEPDPDGAGSATALAYDTRHD